MPSIINTNINSLTAQRNLSSSQLAQSSAMQRLSSGLRINSAKDDAAGLAISDRMTSQIRGLTQAARNANDGISLAQTAEGALGSISTNLQRIRELSVQSANATNSASDRAALQQEVSQLASEVERVATHTQFNGINLLDGTFGGGSNGKFQVGANTGQTIQLDAISSMKSSALGVYNGYNNGTLPIGAASNTAAATTVTVGSTVYDLGSIANDAKAIAMAITKAAIPGLTVTANASTMAGATQGTITAAAASPQAAKIVINGTTVNLQATGNAAGNRSAAVAAINAQSAATGVMATDAGASLTLTASDGRNILVSGFDVGTTTGTAAAEWGLAESTGGVPSGGSLNVNYVAPIGNPGALTIGTLLTAQSLGPTGTAIDKLDISTQLGAEKALSSLDAAMASVNTVRATLGAIQNRFTNTIDNLNTSNENLAASRSRIQDADFAAETSNLSRAQVLQQAGTAMVAQANQLPQGVLALLR